MGCTPFGCARVRSWGACATEKEAQGGGREDDAVSFLRHPPQHTARDLWQRDVVIAAPHRDVDRVHVHPPGP
eukprot:6177429-Pleurochrysis_carterae.AAC.1